MNGREENPILEAEVRGDLEAKLEARLEPTFEAELEGKLEEKLEAQDRGKRAKDTDANAFNPKTKENTFKMLAWYGEVL